MTANSCLIVIDGWGISPKNAPHSIKDAIASAKTPFFSSIKSNSLQTSLNAHGNAVGLPDGLMGNSEVGHLNIGAGRVVYQDIVRIDKSVKDNALHSNQSLSSMLARAHQNTNRIHLLGLLSDGGVHSHIRHLFALIKTIKEAGIGECYLHCFSDGRDTSPTSFLSYYESLQEYITSIGYGKVGTVIGRYYAMDRDKRSERTQLAIDCLTLGKGEFSVDLKETVNAKYSNGEFDEFFKPIVLCNESIIQDNDCCLFFNFRSDRMRQITKALQSCKPSLSITTMTRYSADFDFAILFPPQSLDNVLAEWMSKLNLRQCHIAETEKYAHVTFFFNGGVEKEWPGEDRVLIPSPKVATYDLHPEMSVEQVANATIEAVQSGEYPFVICNFAPPDMVGHTGNFEATIRAVEMTDSCIAKVWEACKQKNTMLFITADHGNAEIMTDLKGNPHTAHTTSDVPFIALLPSENLDDWQVEKRSGALCDVAPTILSCMNLPIPANMTGSVLFKKR